VTLTVTLRALAWSHGPEPDSPTLLRLRDAYLEPFEAPAVTADIAYRTGILARALAGIDTSAPFRPRRSTPRIPRAARTACMASRRGTSFCTLSV
jgi:hypothetical protein